MQLPEFNTDNRGVKVPIKRLKLISDANYGVLNRNIDCDALLKSGYTELTINMQLTHSFANGEPVEEHIRLVFDEYGLTQDLTYEQMEDMMEDIEILNS